MRYYQIKEGTQLNKISSDLKIIASQGKQAQQKNPKIASKVSSVLQQVKNMLAQKVNDKSVQPVKIVAPKPVPEDAGMSTVPGTSTNLVADAMALQKLLADPKISSQLPPEALQLVGNVVSKSKDTVTELNTEKARATDLEKELEDAPRKALQKVRDLRSKTQKLAKKVVNYTEIGDDERAAMNKKDAKSAQNADNALDGMTDGLYALFFNFVFKDENAPLTAEEVDEFIDACIAGKVVDMPAVIRARTGFIDKFVNAPYKKVYDVIAKDLVNFKGMGTTGGALGPGEILLSAVGSPVSTGVGGVKGDLAVDMGGKEGMLGVEVKAGSGSKNSGARLNGTKISDGKGALDKMKSLYKVLGIKEEEMPGKQSYSLTGPYVEKLNNTVFQRFDEAKLKKWTIGVLNALVLNFDDVINYKD